MYDIVGGVKMISINITTQIGSKTIGMISTLKELEWALTEIRARAKEELE